MSNPKHDMRIEARRVRSRIDPLHDNPEHAVEHFFKTVSLSSEDVIAAYWPKGREFDPRPILDECLKRGYTCALPVIQNNSRILNFAVWNETIALVKNTYDIFEPDTKEYVDPSVVIVPMLAFDRRGYRLGQGGGYYDTTIADLRKRKSVKAVGVAYAQQACLFNLPREEHDERMDIIITPQGSHKFI